jgi:hypothetical protein
VITKGVLKHALLTDGPMGLIGLVVRAFSVRELEVLVPEHCATELLLAAHPFQAELSTLDVRFVPHAAVLRPTTAAIQRVVTAVLSKTELGNVAGMSAGAADPCCAEACERAKRAVEMATGALAEHIEAGTVALATTGFLYESVAQKERCSAQGSTARELRVDPEQQAASDHCENTAKCRGIMPPHERPRTRAETKPPAGRRPRSELGHTGHFFTNPEN